MDRDVLLEHFGTLKTSLSFDLDFMDPSTASWESTRRCSEPTLDFETYAELSRPMRLEEGVDLAHRQGNPLFGFFPGEHAHFGFRREHRALHGDGVRVSRGIVRQDQNRGLATTHEVPCHGEDEVGVGLEHPGHEFVDRRHRDLGPLGSECRTPGLPEYAWV